MKRIKLRAILLGFLISVIGHIVIGWLYWKGYFYFITSKYGGAKFLIDYPNSTDILYYFAIFVVSPSVILSGAYLTAKISKGYPILNASLVGLIGASMYLGIETLSGEPSTHYIILGILYTPITVLGGYIFVLRSRFYNKKAT
jgi:hypothetical protein